VENINENQLKQTINIHGMSTLELLSLIGKSIYAIRNFHKGNNHRNFYISTMEINNITLSQDGIWFDTGIEIFNESELGNRFSLDKEEIQNTLEKVKRQTLNNITEIFQTNVIERSLLQNFGQFIPLL